MSPTPAPLDLSRWAPSITRYAEWILADNEADAREWEHRLNSTVAATVEGAVAEAVAWDFIGNRVDRIRRHGHLPDGARSPDFICQTGDVEFALEVTNLSRDHVTKITGLRDPVEVTAGLRSYSPWDRELKDVLTKKASQGTRLTIPYVVLASTLHAEASAILCVRSHVEMLQHSRPNLRGAIDAEGDPVGDIENVTDLATAVFTKKNTTETARRHVSALLIGGFGTYPHVRVLGVLHPEAERQLLSTSIRATPFCFWREWPPQRRVVLGWTDEDEPGDEQRE